MLACQHQEGFDERMYVYVRFTENERVLVVTNFNNEGRKLQVLFPADLLALLDVSGAVEFTDLMGGGKDQ